jgi:hypothetical protein
MHLLRMLRLAQSPANKFISDTAPPSPFHGRGVGGEGKLVYVPV